MCAVYWTSLVILSYIVQCECLAAPQERQKFDTSLQQIVNLNLTQVALIAGNSSVRCNLVPDLCDVQLHLFSGHTFSVPLVLPLTKPTKKAELRPRPVEATVAPTEPRPVQLFAIPTTNNEHNLLIYAEVEPKLKSNKLSNVNKRNRRKRKLPVKLARRPAFLYVLI